MLRVSILAVILTILLGACSAPATPQPTYTPVDVEATAVALAATSLAKTLAAVPSATAVPTSTPTIIPSHTSIPTGTSTSSPTPAPLRWACDPDGQGLAAMELINVSGQEVLVTLLSTLCYKEIQIGDGSSETVKVPFGTYSYSGYIGTDHGFGGSVFLSDSIHTWVLTINPESALLGTP